MIANRRIHWNYALDQAIERARTLRKPLVILEALRCDYPWASDRLHRFVLDGMAEKSRELGSGNSVRYYPYVERGVGEGKGLLAALAKQACIVITDDFPCFFLPHMVQSAAKQSPVRLEKVDSNGFAAPARRGSCLPHGARFSPFPSEKPFCSLDAFSQGKSALAP